MELKGTTPHTTSHVNTFVHGYLTQKYSQHTVNMQSMYKCVGIP